MRCIFLVAVAAVAVMASPAAAQPKERTAIIAIDLGSGLPDFMRAKTAARTQDGLASAGFDVIPYDQAKTKLGGDLASCREGSCLRKVGEALGVATVMTASLSRKDESTVIVFKLVETTTGDTLAEVHEVCDLCGQDELEERIGVAASSLRTKAEAQRMRRAQGGGASQAAGGGVRVAIVAPVTVNLDAARVDALTADLAEALTAELEVTATGGLEVRRQLPAEGVPPECVTTPSCASDVAKRLDAQQVLFLVMVASGNGLQVDTTWIEPSSGHKASRPAFDVANINDAKARFAAVAHQLLPDAPLRKKAGPNGGGLGVMSKAVPNHMTTPAYITATIGIVGLGAGIALGLSTRSKYNTCDTSGTCDQSTKDSIRLTGLVADGGYLLAIGGAVATSILFATSGESAHLVVAPTEGSTGAVSGVTIGAFGTF